MLLCFQTCHLRSRLIRAFHRKTVSREGSFDLPYLPTYSFVKREINGGISAKLSMRGDYHHPLPDVGNNKILGFFYIELPPN